MTEIAKLEAKIAELESKIASRPVVWVLKGPVVYVPELGAYIRPHCWHTPFGLALFSSEEKANEFKRKHSAASDYHSIPFEETEMTSMEPTPLEKELPVSIQPENLKLMQFYLSQYFDLLCEQDEDGEKMKEINELALLVFEIDTILGTHCNDNA